MSIIGALVFWEWSLAASVAVLSIAVGVVTLVAAVAALLGRAAGPALLRRAMTAQLLFALAKLTLWQEPEALGFGAVALGVALALRQDRDARAPAGRRACVRGGRRPGLAARLRPCARGAARSGRRACVRA